MRALLAALVAALAAPALACPANQIALLGVGCPVASASYTGPGDVVSGATAWWGLRAYDAAYASAGGKAANLRNTATSEQCDFPVVASGGIGTAENCTSSSDGDSLATFCAEDSGSCAVTELYDQTGDGCNVTQSTAADQPTLIVDEYEGKAAIYQSSSSVSMSGTCSAISSPATFAMFATSPASAAGGGGAICFTGSEYCYDNGLSYFTGTPILRLTFTVSSVSESSGGASVVQAVVGVANGSSSVLDVNGSVTTGTVGTTTTGNDVYIFEGISGIYLAEGGVWSSLAFSSAQYGAMCNNMNDYYEGSSC